MRPLAVVAFALLTACEQGYTPGQVLPSDANAIAIGGGGVTPTGGGGSDAGDAGSDAGDAGCFEAFNTFGYPAVDNCLGYGSTTAFLTSNNCNLTISFGTTQVCTGVISGADDSFDGGCPQATLTCNALSLPGRITCSSGCQINICDGGGTCLP